LLVLTLLTSSPSILLIKKTDLIKNDNCNVRLPTLLLNDI